MKLNGPSSCNTLYILLHISMERYSFFIKNTTSYFKNHWTKHRLVFILMLNPNMIMQCNISEIFESFMKFRCRPIMLPLRGLRQPLITPKAQVANGATGISELEDN